jgi:hypothetical protein
MFERKCVECHQFLKFRLCGKHAYVHICAVVWMQPAQSEMGGKKRRKVSRPSRDNTVGTEIAIDAQHLTLMHGVRSFNTVDSEADGRGKSMAIVEKEHNANENSIEKRSTFPGYFSNLEQVQVHERNDENQMTFRFAMSAAPEDSGQGGPDNSGKNINSDIDHNNPGLEESGVRINAFEATAHLSSLGIIEINGSCVQNDVAKDKSGTQNDISQTMVQELDMGMDAGNWQNKKRETDTGLMPNANKYLNDGPSMKRLRKPHNPLITAMVRAGHIPVFSKPDEGVARMFELSVKLLVNVHGLSDVDVMERLSPYLLYAKQDLPESIRNAISDAPDNVSRESWLGFNDDGQEFRNSIVAARNVQLRFARNAMEKTFMETAGQDRSKWPSFFTEFNMKQRLLSMQLHEFFRPGATREEYQRGLDLMRIIYAGVHILAVKSCKEKHLSVLNWKQLTGEDFCGWLLFNPTVDGDIQLGEPSDMPDENIGRLRNNACLAFEGLCVMLMYFITHRASSSESSCTFSSLTEVSRNESTSLPLEPGDVPPESILETRKGKAVKKPFPFEADFQSSKLFTMLKKHNAVGNRVLSVYFTWQLARLRNHAEFKQAIEENWQHITNVSNATKRRKPSTLADAMEFTHVEEFETEDVMRSLYG